MSIKGNIMKKSKLKRINEINEEVQKLKNEKHEIKSFLNNSAIELLHNISKYKEIKNLSDFNLKYIDNSKIIYERSVYEGRDYNNQDIYSYITYELDSNLLYDELLLEKYISQLKENILIKKNKELENIKLLEKEKEEKEKQDYLKLKKKFEK